MQIDYLAIVQNCLPGKIAKYLVRILRKKQQVCICIVVEYWLKLEFEPFVVGSKIPGRKKIGPSFRFRNAKIHSIDLVGFSIVKKHILRGRSSIAKAVPKIKAKSTTIR